MWGGAGRGGSGLYCMAVWTTPGSRKNTDTQEGQECSVWGEEDGMEYCCADTSPNCGVYKLGKRD